MSQRVTLDPADVDAIAQRVAELLRGEPVSPELIDAAEVARRHGMSRDWVYEHADELGACRLGSGPRARLRFAPAVVAEYAEAAEPFPTSTPARRSAPPSKLRPRSDLLPIHTATKGGSRDDD